jgi:cytochrome c553
MFQRLICAGIALAAFASGSVRADDDAGLAALKARVAALESELAALKAAQRPVELGQQMLELQIRHARLWYAGQRDNWTLAVFQLAEFREAIDGIIEANGEHPALQPERLADVMPAHMGPPLKALQAAVDGKDRAAFTAAYDQLTGACNACHEAASFGFNRFQRPRTPLLDNQQYGPGPDAAD